MNSNATPMKVATIAKNAIRSATTMKAFADSIGVQQSNLSAQLNGSRYVSPKLAAILAKSFNLRFDFLTAGEGDAYETTPEPSILDTATFEDNYLDSPLLKKSVETTKQRDQTSEDPSKRRTSAEERLVYLEARVNFLKSVILRIAAVVCEETRNKEAKEDIRLLVASLTEDMSI